MNLYHVIYYLLYIVLYYITYSYNIITFILYYTLQSVILYYIFIVYISISAPDQVSCFKLSLCTQEEEPRPTAAMVIDGPQPDHDLEIEAAGNGVAEDGEASEFDSLRSSLLTFVEGLDVEALEPARGSVARLKQWRHLVDAATEPQVHSSAWRSPGNIYLYKYLYNINYYSVI